MNAVIPVIPRATRLRLALRHGQYRCRRTAGDLKTDGNRPAMKDRLLSSQDYKDCLGLPEVEAWEKRFSANFE